MDDKKYQIFVSSTYEDLEKSREKIIETVLSLYHFPLGMEMFSADDSEQWEIIQETINVSDYYIIIIGHRYGSLTKEGISYTEKEYDYAKSRGLPILAFIRNRNVSTLPNERDSDPKLLSKLDEFIEKATADKMCDFWDGIDDLATKVAVALPKVMRRSPQIGWIRGSEAMSKEVSQELVELSAENRDLRQKLEELKSLIGKDKPTISVDINSSHSLDFECTQVAQDIYVNLPDPLTQSNITTPLMSLVSEKDIEDYNKSLPSQEVVDNYNFDKRYIYLAKNDSVALSLNVSNNGTSKANDIYVNIEFPDFVSVIEKESLDGLSEPENPIPESPLVAAQKKLRLTSQSSIMRTLDLVSNFQQPSFNSLGAMKLAKPIPLERKYSSRLKNNIATLSLKSLMHTRTKSFCEFVLVPLSAGKGHVKITVICEEYKTQERFEIPISIEFEE